MLIIEKWDEELHPRDDAGRFAESGGGGGAATDTDSDADDEESDAMPGREPQADDFVRHVSGDRSFRDADTAEAVLASLVNRDLDQPFAFVTNDEQVLRGAAAAYDALKGLKDEGYTMPDGIEIVEAEDQHEVVSGQTREMVGPGGDKYKILTMYVPPELPDDVKLDKAVKAAFGGISVESGKKVRDYVARSFDDLVVHEMGHVQTWDALRDVDAWIDLQGKLPMHITRVISAAQSVSKYAVKNPHEFLAEAFLFQHRGEKLSADAEKLYKSLNGPAIKEYDGLSVA